ncbi:MAG: amidohydrolase [Sporomusaceae bacterium]|nr:amidohydrolase [Sporomusaceae bacterium]
MKIIDFRFRPNTADTLAGIGNSPMFKDLCATIDFPTMKPQTMVEIVADLDKYNIIKAVITGRDCETTYPAKSNNASVIDFVKKYPNKFIGFSGVDPHKGMRGINELKRNVKEQGLKGAAIDPYLAQIYVNDARYYPTYAKCCELNIPVIITAGPATLVPRAIIDHVAPKYIDIVARDFPELKIVVSHGGYPWVNEMITIAQRNRNVYFELSEYEAFPLSEAYVHAINTIISDKVIYASAHPFVDFKTALGIYEKMPFNNEIREKIMYKNAAAILNLNDVSDKKTNPQQYEKSIIENVIRELAKRGIVPA